MYNYYSVLAKRIKKLKKEKLLSTRFIKSLNDIEISKILNYSQKDFKLYIETLEALYTNKIIVTKEIEDNAKRALDIIFSNINKKNKIEYLTLLTDTFFLHSKNSVNATINFLSLENKYKVDSVIDIFTDYKRPYVVNADKVILEIKRCKNKHQVIALTNLLTKEYLLNNKNLTYLIELIHQNPKYKYYKYPVSLVINYEFLNSVNNVKLLPYLFKLENIDDIKLIFDCFKTPAMLKSSINFKFVESIIKEGHKNYYKYLNYLVLNKDKISDISFEKIINAIKLSKNQYQIEGLVSLVNTNIINNSLIHTKFINAIQNSREEYKIKGLLNIAFNDKLLKKFEIANYIIDGIVNSKHDYQTNSLLFCADYLDKSIYYKEIITEIIRSNRINCKYTNLFIQKDLYSRNDYLKLYYRLMDYKTPEQKDLFIKILDIRDLFNYDFNNYFNMIEKANIYQCSAIFELFSYGFYKHKYFDLIKYLFIFKDFKHVDLFKEILIQINRVGYERSIELIRLISNTTVDIDILYDYYINKLKKRVIEFDEADLKFYENRTKEEIKKLKKIRVDKID